MPDPVPADQQTQPAPPAGMMRGDAKDDADGFAQAAGRAKARAKQEDEAFQKKDDLKRKAEARADQIIEGVDLDALAKEVDEDFSMASKFRNLRQMTPAATAKLEELRQRVKARKAEAKPVEGDVKDGMKPAAAVAPAAGAAKPAGALDATDPPASAPAAAAAPGATVPPAGAAPVGDPAKPAEADEFTQKLDALRKEFDIKLTAQKEAQKKLETENQTLKAEKQKFEQAQKQAAEQKRVEQFTTAAKAAGIPEDLADFAFGKAQDIVNEFGGKMTYAQIFEKLEAKHPSIFKNQSVVPQAKDDTTETTFRVQPGTGSNTGGVGSKPPVKPKQEKGADSWDESRRKLKAQVRG